jgi:hypothetical protein
MRKMLSVVVLSAFGCVPYSWGQNTDAAQKVSDALTAYGPLPVTVVVKTPRRVEFCRTVPPDGGQQCVYQTVYDTSTQTTSQLVTATNIRVAKSSSLNWGTATHTQLPDQVSVADVLYQDCGPGVLTANISISVSFQRSSSMTITKQVTHTVGTQLSGTAKIGDAFTVGVQISEQNSEMNGTSTLSGNQVTVTQSVGGSQQLQPQTAIVAEEQVWPVHYVIPFTATVTVDADLSQNDKGFTHLSDILGETQRTFDIAGTVTADDANQAVLKTFAYPYDPSKCTSGKDIATKGRFVPVSGTKLLDSSARLMLKR